MFSSISLYIFSILLIVFPLLTNFFQKLSTNNLFDSFYEIIKVFNYSIASLFIIFFIINVIDYLKNKAPLSKPVTVGIITLVLFLMPTFLTVAQHTTFAIGG